MPNSYSFELPYCDSTEIQTEIWCNHVAKFTKTGHGTFLEFNDMTVFEKFVKRYFVNVLGWTLEYENTFVRKPELS
jgi:hypothetical protein